MIDPKKMFFMAALASAPAFIGADIATQPLLPISEHIVYARTIGGKSDEVEVSTRLVDSKDGAWYEVISSAPDQDSTYRLDARTLFANYMDITSRGSDATIRRVTSVLENKAKTGPDEVLLSSFEALPYTLRAFPWGSRQKAKLVFLGAGRGADFSFDLSVTGKESLSVGSSDIQCWKAQLSLGGVLGAFMGRELSGSPRITRTIWSGRSPPQPAPAPPQASSAS